MQRATLIFFAIFAMIFNTFLHAHTAFIQRLEVQEFINTMVYQHKFNRQELTNLMKEVVLQPEIIEAMNKPHEKKPWNVYKDLFLTEERLQGGLAFWKANRKALEKAEKQYKVPSNIIVAIIGIETIYGKKQGNYRVIDALSTLAFDYPSRAPFFKKELKEFLLLCREHKVPATQYYGSYAGAMGKPQFMPSSYRYYAADFSGKAKKDLMNDDQAVIASVANYIHKHGWNVHQGIAQPARITGTQYKHINTASKSAIYTVKQLAHAGIMPVTASINTPKLSGLIELTSESSSEYWLAYPNFYVITRYNTSPQYAMAVYLLSLQLKNQWTAASIKRKFAYA